MSLEVQKVLKVPKYIKPHNWQFGRFFWLFWLFFIRFKKSQKVPKNLDYTKKVF